MNRHPPISRSKIANGQPLILRDELAIDRTRLANERTLLAWLRTALMMLASGLTLIKLFEGVVSAELLGAALIPISAITAFYGVRRFFIVREQIGAVGRPGESHQR
jgi:putative membrane protein